MLRRPIESAVVSRHQGEYPIMSPPHNPKAAIQIALESLSVWLKGADTVEKLRRS